jgi:ABC-type glycerol-3-phosphate transport system substrate-binding protein
MSKEKRNLSRRDFLRVSALCAGGAALAACAPQAQTPTAVQPVANQANPTTAPAKTENVEIVFVTTETSDSSSALFKPVYDKFHQVHPEIAVKYLGIANTTWGDYFDKMAVVIAGGSQVDFAKIPTEGGRTAVARGLIIPIDPYIQATPSIKDYIANVSPKLEKVFTYSGKTYMLPYDYNNMMVWINTDRLKEAGLEMPKETWTFSDFTDYARKLTVRNGDNVTKWGFQFFTGPFGMCPWFFNNGLEGILGGPAMDKPLANDPKFLEVIQMLHGLIYADKVAPRLDATNLPAKFEDGTIAMVICGRWNVTTYQKEGFNACEVAYWPTGTRLVTEVGCGGWGLFSASKYKDQTWTWESFLLTEDSNRTLELGGSNISSIRTVAYDPNFINYPKTTGKLFYESIDRNDIPVMSVTAPPDYSDMESILNRHTSTIFSDPDASKIPGELDALQKDLEAMVAKRPAEWAGMFQ